MIPRGYPQVSVRAKIGFAPWFALIVITLGVLHDHGVIKLDGSGTTRPHHRAPAAAPPSRAALATIPDDYRALYVASGDRCPGLSWGVLAGIGKVESDHGRSSAPGVRWGLNAFGCCAGPMQFNVRNGPPSTWDHYGRGGDVYNPRDAIPAAARLLCANGIGGPLSPAHDPCPGVVGTPAQHRAIRAYNHACSYVRQVLTLRDSYQAKGRR